MISPRALLRGALAALVLAAGTLAASALAASALVISALAADPTPGPTPSVRPPTCTERYPADGPAGVDLQLGCVVNELIGFLGGVGEPGGSHRLSEYGVPIGVGAAALVLLALAIRQVRRAAGRRLAAAAPSAVWSCPTCRSLNDASHDHCYRCGRPFEPGDLELRTDAEPLAPQSFGRRSDGRRRKDEPG